MAIVNIPDTNTTLREIDEIKSFLAGIGIEYQRWQASYDISPEAPEDEILQAYSAEIEKLKMTGGYTAADVITLEPTTPNLPEMLAKFSREHWHDEDEVRFVIKGRGLFHIAPVNSGVVSIEMEAGDLICVPRGTPHWFNLCEDQSIRAIRLFQNPALWTPFYTESGADEKYQPVCFGVSYIPKAA